MSVFDTEQKNPNKNKILPQHPARLIVAGPSNCGKTNWLMNLLMHEDAPWDSIHLFYGADQPKYDILEKYYAGEPIKDKGGETKKLSKSRKDKIFFQKIKGMPTNEWMEAFRNPDRYSIPACIILDDLMLQTDKSSEINKLFTIGSHHCNSTVINLCQSIFTNKLQRNNADYYVVFNFDQDQTQIRTLFTQLEPKNWKNLMDSYKECTKVPYSWFMVDLKCKNANQSHLKYRVNAFDEIIEVM